MFANERLGRACSFLTAMPRRRPLATQRYEECASPEPVAVVRYRADAANDDNR